jgi:hypothetical protein
MTLDNSIYIVYIVDMAMTLKQIKFDEQDLEAVETIQRLYGCESFSQAVRLAARIAAAHPRLGFPIPASPKHAAKRRPMRLAGMFRLPATVSDAEVDRALESVTSSGQQETLAEWVFDADGNLEIASLPPQLARWRRR